MNPFRYRSYYYDSDIQMYYLQSRYYDPELGRFINCDDANYIGLEPTVVSYNPFVYCENNPVNGIDETGTFGTPIQWACGIIGAIIGIPFGKWVANRLGYYSGLKYQAIWSAVIVGGFAIGWFAGPKVITKLVKIYLQNNPQIMIKIVRLFGPAVLEQIRKVLGISINAVAKVIPYSWQQAEEILRNIIGSVNSVSDRTLKTPFGNRVCDALNQSKRIIGESKYGYQGLSKFIKQEILKDTYLIGKGYEVEWHFFISQTTGKGGPSAPLLEALERAGIDVIMHF